MLTDRELLELAAKAAGVEYHIDYIDGCPKLVANNYGAVWNPLSNDGTALRLAVKLCLHPAPFPAGARVRFQNHILDTCEIEEHGDPYAATRRAIVRAAAEIGKAMPC
jgi:hypothetical protein